MRDTREPLDTYDDQGDYDWDYDEEDDRGPRPKILWGRVLSLVLFMLIAFFIGRWSKDAGVSQAAFDDLETENTELATANEDLEEQLADAQAALGNQDPGDPDDGDGNNGDGNNNSETLEPKVHTVQSGETLSDIVKKEYGCTIVVDEEGAGTNEVDMTDNVTETNEAEATQEGTVFDPAALAPGQEILLPQLPAGYDCPS